MGAATSVNDDAALEREADALGEQIAIAAEFAKSAVDQLKRLQSRSALIRKELKDEPE